MPTNNDLLKAYLESLVAVGAKSRVLIAQILEQALSKTITEDMRRDIEAEIFFKYMQSFEDFGAF